MNTTQSECPMTKAQGPNKSQTPISRWSLVIGHWTFQLATLAALLATALPTTATTVATNVNFSLVDFGLTAVASRKVIITPMTTPNASASSVVIGDIRRATTDTNGSFTLTNVVLGLYSCEVLPASGSSISSRFQILINSSADVVVAAANMAANASSTFPPGSVAWSAASSELRYLASSNPVFTGTLSGNGGGLTNIPEIAVASLTADLAAKAPLSSPVFTGVINGNGSGLSGIPESAVTSLTTDLALKAPLASPTFTGSITGNGAAVTNVPGAMLDVTKPPFNATGNGVTDDTTAFTSALTASASSGLPVYVPNKTFKVTPFTMTSKQTLYGTGGKLLFSSSSSAVAVTIDYTATNVTLFGLEIDGGVAAGIPSSDDGRTGLLYWNCQQPNWSVHDLYVHGFGKGIEVFGLGGSTDGIGRLNNCEVRYCYKGLQVDNQAEYLTFTGIKCVQNFYGLAEFAGNNTFSSCNFSRNNINCNMATVNPGDNSAHCLFAACTFNHANTYALVSTNTPLGVVFDGCAFLPPIMYMTNVQGFSFNNCLMGWTSGPNTITFDHSTNCSILFPQTPYGSTAALNYSVVQTSCSNVVYQLLGNSGSIVTNTQASATFGGITTSSPAVSGPSMYTFSSVFTFSGDASGFGWNNSANNTAWMTLDSTGLNLKVGTVTLPATNTAPSSATPVKWVTINVGGIAYRIGLCQ
jgi:hypothetical protein